MLAESPPQTTSLLSRARWHVPLGEADSALREFEQAVHDRDSLAPFIGIEPAFDSIRREPRFHALSLSIGLAH